eukprot:2400312-Rhodomonas_salina.2
MVRLRPRLLDSDLNDLKTSALFFKSFCETGFCSPCSKWSFGHLYARDSGTAKSCKVASPSST